MSDIDFAVLSDSYWLFKQDRLAADKHAAELKTKESALKAQIMEGMRELKLSAVGGTLVRLTLDTKPTDEPMVKDWAAVYAHIVETKDFSLLEKRIGKAACKERWEQGVDVPGVEKFQVYKLHESEVKS